MTTDATCPRCGKADETILHAIRDCEDIKDLWIRFVRPSYWEQFFSCNLVKWVDWNLKTDVGSDLAKDWRIGFEVVCWQVWKNRNLLVFEDHTSNKDDLFFAAWFTISDIITVADQDKKPVVDPKANRMGQDTAACGEVIRDCSGAFLLGYSSNLGSCSTLWADLRGILEGLNLLWASGFYKVDIESDSKMSISMIEQGVPSTHPCADLVYRIREMSNQVADFLARMGHTLQHEVEVFTRTPVECQGLLAKDVKGIDPSCVCAA
ncbi:putative ribonuclease H protein At1g65750 family [Senna tora]|uniref:Putative ribonuclease H protein At1g65750 family n=1 Tax=Senna tora TaxID=362788 RepID=A0A834TG27_9FABA|nr:putative ribonuclease H protein At1g65750 family [Senna tora]